MWGRIKTQLAKIKVGFLPGQLLAAVIRAQELHIVWFFFHKHLLMETTAETLKPHMVDLLYA
jgi:hypothetical protein